MARNERRENAPKKPEDGLDKVTVDINRITKVVKGGRKLRFAALVVVGDRKGRVGIGVGKSAETSEAIEKATTAAKKHMITIALDSTTIPHEITGNFEKTKVLMMPAKEGKGVIAGGSVRTVVELAGIKDIVTKLYGSNNKVNCVKATINGLKKLKTKEEVAHLRGISVDSL